MKIFAVTVLSLEILWLHASQITHVKVDRYKMDLVEKGTPYSEEIEIDENKDVEVFRVPAHNDVEGADFYHDFKLRVTVTRILSRKVCFISKLDSAMSSPGKLKADFNRAASQAGSLPVETDSTVVIVTEPANRLNLTKEILDFCGALPIYYTEHTKVDPSNGNGTAIIQKRRRKRDKIIKHHKSCLRTFGRDIFEYVKKDGCFDEDTYWDIECKMEDKFRSCFHYVTCINQVPVGRLQYNCTSLHKSSQNPICCDYICPGPVSSEN